MSELIAIAYPDEATVTRATTNLAEAIGDGTIEVEDVVVILRDRTAPSTSGRAAPGSGRPRRAGPCGAV